MGCYYVCLVLCWQIPVCNSSKLVFSAAQKYYLTLLWPIGRKVIHFGIRKYKQRASANEISDLAVPCSWDDPKPYWEAKCRLPTVGEDQR